MKKDTRGDFRPKMTPLLVEVEETQRIKKRKY
jgi:hypothetical protein